MYEGKEKLYESVLKRNEKFCFGIEKGGTSEFLSGYGFEATGTMDSNVLEDMFYKDEHGTPVAKVNGTHCLVTAIKGAS